MSEIETSSPQANPKSKFHRLKGNPRRLLVEILILGSLYAIYTFARNANEASASKAFENAKLIIRWEEFFSIYREQPIHDFFLNHEWVLIASNYFYGSLHFIATIFALVWVFVKDPKRYSLVRNTIVISTLIALLGFIFFPLMPPRLLPESYGYIDSLAKFPTFWSFNQEEFATISNQYAAMPSVHIIWASWVVFALFPYLKNWFIKALVIMYPITTFFVIIVTSNHYFLDAVAAIIILLIAYLASRKITSLTTRSAIDKTASLAVIKAS
jgi:hypothetical protein